MRHAKVLMMVGGLFLATGQMAQGQTLFDENFNYTPRGSGSFPGTIDPSWTIIGGTPHFTNPFDQASEVAQRLLDLARSNHDKLVNA